MAPQQWLHQPNMWQPPRATAGSDMGKPAQQLASNQRRFTVVLDLDETMVRTAKHLHTAEDDAAASVAAAAPGAFVVRSSCCHNAPRLVPFCWPNVCTGLHHPFASFTFRLHRCMQSCLQESMGHFWLCRDLGCPSSCHEFLVLLSLWCSLLQPLVRTPSHGM